MVCQTPSMPQGSARFQWGWRQVSEAFADTRSVKQA